MRTAELAARRRTVRRNSHLTMSNSPPRSRGAFLHPGFATSLHSPRIEGWAERRETFGCSAEHPLGLHMTRQARRLRGALRPIARQDARERAYDAGRSPLGAPPWRFFTRGRASVSLGARRPSTAGSCLRLRAASSSQPGRSAWRAGSRASRGERLRAAAAGRHSSLRLQDRLRRRPSRARMRIL